MKILLITLFTWLTVANDSLTIVSVGEAEIVREKILVEKVIKADGVTPNDLTSAQQALDIIQNDFRYYKKIFDVLNSKVAPSDSDVKYSYYSNSSIDYLIRLNVFKEGESSKLKVRLFDIKKELSSYENTYALTDDRNLGHEIAHETYLKIVGKPPIFKDKIVFVSDIDSKRGNKELYIMDFDGASKKRLTWHQGVVLSPAVSHDGTKILYSLISDSSKKHNVSLRIYDMQTGKSKTVSSRKGINSGAIFTQNNDEIILTLSHQGNAELYRMNLKTKKLTRLTRHGAPDVDPSINQDGSRLTFLSGRSGSAHIYLMTPTSLENEVKRIGFVGTCNGTPRFSPDGKEIAFSAWLDNRFDLFRLNGDGSGLGRLTKDFGSNEGPDYSKDGQFIVFTSLRVLSQKKADQSLYIMDRDGEILGPLTKNYGKCKSPRWLKFL